MSEVIIIAEAGVNHNGNFDLAIELIDAAANTGADYVKFQTFKAENLVTFDAPQAEYQKKNIASEHEQKQYEMLKKLELTTSDFTKLKEYASKRNIGFLSTPFDLESADFLSELGMDYFKISSGDLTNGPLLAHVARKSLPVIISTGMADFDEVESAVDLLIGEGKSRTNIIVLQCNTEYPTPLEDVNLRTMLTFEEKLKVDVGFSDHTIGNECAVAAVAMGAKFIEKHLTLDQTMEGPDHAASANPAEFKAMVQMIRNVSKAMGNDVKQPSPSETKNIPIARKSIHISRYLPAGTVITLDDLAMKRPGTGISPMHYEQFIGKQTSRDLEKDHMLTKEDVK